MTDDYTFFRWMVESHQIRPSARAIVVNPSSGHFMVEKNHGALDHYLNFVGGGVELGETLEACLMREFQEETDAGIVRMEYLFVVEHFITFEGEITHGLEHYFEVALDREDVRSSTEGIEFPWLPKDDLAEADLRPHIVRDAIATGTYRTIRHLISKDSVG
jgi:8-oxo-dGTP pyrophosphatase MutT (NUDIX family)